jgi:hypothetical protein
MFNELAPPSPTQNALSSHAYHNRECEMANVRQTPNGDWPAQVRRRETKPQVSTFKRNSIPFLTCSKWRLKTGELPCPPTLPRWFGALKWRGAGNIACCRARSPNYSPRAIRAAPGCLRPSCGSPSKPGCGWARYSPLLGATWTNLNALPPCRTRKRGMPAKCRSVPQPLRPYPPCPATFRTEEYSGHGSGRIAGKTHGAVR